MDEHVKMVPSLCTQCGGTVEVDANAETAKCPFCGMTFVVEKAVNNYNVKYANIQHADNVNIDVTGAVKEVLDFAGNQMNESREERKERRKEEAAQSMMMQSAFLKMFGFMMIGMFIFAIVGFIVMQFTGNSENDSNVVATTADSGESYIYSQVDDEYIYINISGANIAEWRYKEFESTSGMAMDYENKNSDGYTSCFHPESYASDGVYFIVHAAYEDENVTATSEPMYYSVTRLTIQDGQIQEADQPEIVDSLDQYDFN